VLAGDFELMALVRDLSEEAGVLHGKGRLIRKGLKEIHDFLGEGFRLPSPDDQNTDSNPAGRGPLMSRKLVSRVGLEPTTP
jgi:hypothetical protein